MNTVVAFDLDGTLLRGNCSYAFSRFLYERGILTLSDLFFCIRTYLKSRFFRLPLDQLHQSVFERLFDGRSLHEIKELVAEFVHTRIEPMWYPPALRELQTWKRRGAQLILLSSSPEMLVKPIAEMLGLCEAYGSRYTTDPEGRLNGLSCILDGNVKVNFLKRFAAWHQTERMIAYSDHVYDLPLLEYVSNPVVVNPGRKLKKIALRRGWDILSDG